MRFLGVNERPKPGRLYVLLLQEMGLWRDIPDVPMPTVTIIRKNQPFVFVREMFEEISKLKVDNNVWYQVIYGEMIGISCNGYLNFGHVMAELEETDVLK